VVPYRVTLAVVLTALGAAGLWFLARGGGSAAQPLRRPGAAPGAHRMHSYSTEPLTEVERLLADP
jgi:hypothetical protein